MGKTVFAEVGICYDLYKVSCLKNPADAYGLLPNSNVAFINVSVNKAQASKVIFGGIGNLIRNSPYFRERFPFNAIDHDRAALPARRVRVSGRSQRAGAAR